MGKRYESSKKHVDSLIEVNKKTLDDEEIAKKEFSFLSDIEIMLNDLDDETLASVENVEIAKEVTHTSIEMDKQNNSKEMNNACSEIEQEISKLKDGLKKFDKLEDHSFGKGSVKEAKKDYLDQIAKYQNLISTLNDSNIDKVMTKNEQSGLSGDSGGLDNTQYLEEVLSSLQEGLDDTFDREMVLAGAEERKLIKPRIQTSSGTVKGRWEDDVFFFDDDFVPPYKNEKGFTIAEIKQNLNDEYGIELAGIPFIGGVADFSSVSIATVSTKEIVIASKGISSEEYDALSPSDRTKLFSEVFKANNRTKNFEIADQLISNKQVEIAGLSPGYTADDVRKWRRDNNHLFTWDEQVNGGYNLVPTIIHGNIQHTGLVGTASKAQEYFSERKDDDSSKYSWNEDEATVSLNEFISKYKNDKI